VKQVPQQGRQSSTSDWVREHQRAVLLTLVVIATTLRALLVIRSPTMYGYVYDFYHEGIQKFYTLGRLPIAADCWQCYHPPVFYLMGLRSISLGKRIVAGPVGLADPALRFVGILPIARGKIPPGHLTDLPFYCSVWTTLHAMAWGDMTFFSDPSRHGFHLKPYPRKHLNPWLASSGLILGLVPDGLAVIGFLVTLRRRVLWPLAATCVLTSAAYVTWFLAQESWALKTKYILFLLPAYVLYALLGGRWLQRLVPVAGRIVWLTLGALVVAAHLYLMDFASR